MAEPTFIPRTHWACHVLEGAAMAGRDVDCTKGCSDGRSEDFKQANASPR
jgi:hypothetical protein